jgi:hypothetical protein
MAIPVLEQIVEQVKALPDNLQHQVLTFVRSLHTTAGRGTPDALLLQLAGVISVDDVASIGLQWQHASDIFKQLKI